MKVKNQKPSKNIIDMRAPVARSGPGKQDRENDPSSPMKRLKDAGAKQKNYFSAARLKKL